MPSREIEPTWSWRTVHQFHSRRPELVDPDLVHARKEGVRTRPMRRPSGQDLHAHQLVRKSRLSAIQLLLLTSAFLVKWNETASRPQPLSLITGQPEDNSNRGSAPAPRLCMARGRVPARRAQSCLRPGCPEPR